MVIIISKLSMFRKIIVIFILFSCVSCQKIKQWKIIESTKAVVVDEDTLNTINVVRDSENLTVGVLLPLSGVAKQIGDGIVNALQLAMNKSNSTILLKFFDTKGTSLGATQAINRAIRSGIDAIIGPVFTAEVDAIQGIASKNNILIFSLSNEENLRNKDNLFVSAVIPQQEINLLISYMINESDTTTFVSLMPNSKYGANTNKILRNTIVGKDGLLIKTDYYENNDRKMMTKISDLINYYEVPQTLYDEYQKKKAEQQLLGSNQDVSFVVEEKDRLYPKALFVSDNNRTVENIASLLFMIQRDRDRIQLLTTSKIDGKDITLKNPYMDGVIFVSIDPNGFKTFTEEYRKIYLEEPTQLSAVAYDLIEVLNKVYSKKDNKYLIDKVKLLNPYGFEGVCGKFRFLPNGLVERNLFVLQIKDKEKVILYNIPDFLNY